MATKSPMRMVESGGPRKWAPSKDATTFVSPMKNMAADELGLLLEGRGIYGNQRNTVPNRSGSAPPTIEGSFAAFGNLLAQQSPGLSSSLASLSSVIGNYQSEEQLRADPSYFTYYCANVNLNPRLPPPIVSRENRHLVRQIGGLGNNWRSITFDDRGDGSVHLSKGSLSTHNEEAEDDDSPHQISDDWAESTNALLPEQNAAYLAGRHKSLVDLIQEDFPRTPSPVYNHHPSQATTDEPIDVDIQSIALDNLSIKKSPESKSAQHDVSVEAHSEGSNIRGLTVHSDSSITSLQEKPYKNTELIHKDVDSRENTIISGPTKSDSSKSILTIEDSKNKQEQQFYEKNVQQQPYSLRNTTYQAHGFQSQLVAQAHPIFSSVEAQPVVRPPGPTPPLYTAATAYMTSGNPFYPNISPSGLYSPQYNMGGYAVTNPFVTPYIAGYPSHATIPTQFDGRNSGGSTGESISHVTDQRLNKFYGQHGLMVQPPFLDPLHMPYFQPEAYGAQGQYGHFSPRGVFGGRVDSFDLSPRKGGIPLGSPIMPGSPVGGTNYLGRRNEIRAPPGSIRNVGLYSGLQGQRGTESFNDVKKHSFLEELRASNARKFDLSDIAGRIVEFSVDQHGSRFIQQKLESCSAEEKASVFKEVLPHASKLMVDVFGNYVIQKFFEYGSHEQRKELADQLSGNMLNLSLQMYGCRVIQKALEVIELDQKIQLVDELNGHVVRCVRDQNGNHVIQKCIECIPTEEIGYVISSFRGQVASLSTHPYGCRVIQRVLEHCSDERQSRCIVDEILESAYELAHDQYGNYVTQHVLERGNPHERRQIINMLTGKIVQMSQHKYASNVIEKCLEHGDIAERELLIGEIIGQSEENDNLLMMMKDQFANYVVQKILEISNDKQREILLNRIKVHLHALKKYTYGKHIVGRFEQLCDEELENIGSESKAV